MLSIKNNMMAANAARHLGKSYDALAKSVERLSSGLRINTARDDAAGMAVRELIRADIGVLRQASRNAGDGISLLQTAEGALGQVDAILVRMKELAQQAATGTYSTTQRSIMNNEYAELSAEITRISLSASFNEVQLLNSTTAVNIHVGSGNITITPQIINATTLSVGQTLATKETQVNLVSVADPGDDYILAADITTTTGTDYQFIFEFGSEGTVSVDLSAYATSGISLTDLVTQINAQVAVDTGTAYTCASALYDSDVGSYSLQLQARNAGTAGAAFAITDTNSIGILDATTDFSETVNGAAGSGNLLTSETAAQAALSVIDDAITIKVSYIAQLGYWMNRLDAAVSVIDIQAENLQIAESRISDADVATEMSEMTRTQVLAQAGVAMLAQANAMPQMALTLLR
jgi:flagellin